ncbi:MAG TPA: hypothetical protein VK012_03575 [Gemmatimonadales bacterium]|nr:hypothetical protein [Gemmatimonadales bacterium]
MRAPAGAVAAIAALALIGCQDRAGNQDAEANGRLYTEWFYGSDFERLWDRFSPEMKETFPTSAELASFAGDAVAELGREQGSPQEAVVEEDSLTIYTRLASFDRAPNPVLLQWTLARDGKVTGFVVGPAPD